jgi:small subunit ribosomal protein S4
MFFQKMCIKNIMPKAKRYKFFKVNLWGRLFVLKHFKGRRVMYARINRRHTLRKIRVNAMKLRRKSHSIKGLGLLASFRLKNYYLTLSEYKIKQYIKKSRYLPFFKIKFRAKPLRIEDKFVSLLESRIENILQRTGLVSVHGIKQLLSHRKILLNGKVVTRGSVDVSPGDIVSFKSVELKKRFLYRLLKYKNVIKGLSSKYQQKKKYPMLSPFLTANKLNYLTVSF